MNILRVQQKVKLLSISVLPAKHPQSGRRYSEDVQRVRCVNSERIAMTKKPHEDTRLAKFVERRVLELRPRKSQAEIAAEAGYVNQNMITMIKQGRSKVALDRVPALANALECDPAYLMRLALEQAIGRTAAEAAHSQPQSARACARSPSRRVAASSKRPLMRFAAPAAPSKAGQRTLPILRPAPESSDPAPETTPAKSIPSRQKHHARLQYPGVLTSHMVGQQEGGDER